MTHLLGVRRIPRNHLRAIRGGGGKLHPLDAKQCDEAGLTRSDLIRLDWEDQQSGYIKDEDFDESMVCLGDLASPTGPVFENSRR